MQLETKKTAVRDQSDVWVIPAALRQLAECGDTELLVELVDIFQSDTIVRLEKLQRLLAAGDFPGTRTEAHTIKGSALQIGANRMARFCQQMEIESQKAQAGELARLFQAVRESFAEVCTAIAERRESSGTPVPW